MSHTTTAGFDLQALENNIQDEIAKRIARHTEVYSGTDVDKGNWYGLAMMHAAEIIALEFKLARGE